MGGPNIRSDYHIEAGEELFYMLKGEMTLKIVKDGQFLDKVIREVRSPPCPSVAVN